jgi:hypothetical protein
MLKNLINQIKSYCNDKLIRIFFYIVHTLFLVFSFLINYLTNIRYGYLSTKTFHLLVIFFLVKFFIEIISFIIKLIMTFIVVPILIPIFVISILLDIIYYVINIAK